MEKDLLSDSLSGEFEGIDDELFAGIAIKGKQT